MIILLSANPPQGFHGGAIPYHMRSQWGIYIEEKMTQYIEYIIGGKGFSYVVYKKWSSNLMKKYKGV